MRCDCLHNLRIGDHCLKCDGPMIEKTATAAVIIYFDGCCDVMEQRLTLEQAYKLMNRLAEVLD